MRILIVNKFLFPNGGSESYIFGLGKELVRQGHEVQYFGMEHAGRIVGNRAESYTSEVDFHASGAAGFMAPFKLLYSREARKKLRVVLEDFRPEAVHFNNINFQLTPSVIDEVRAYDRRTGNRTRILVTAHDSQWMCPGHLLRVPSTGELCRRCVDGSVWNCAKNRCIHNSRVRSILGSLEGWLYRRKKTYRQVDAVICPSAFMAEILSHHPMLQGKCVVMHNYVDPPEREDRGEDDGYVLYFGRYGEEKGLHQMLEAVRRCEGIPFLIAGRGELQPEVDQAVREAGELPDGTPRLKDVGFQSGEALRSLVRKARLVVFPSVCHENCPLSLMEAQAAGVPVIASGLGGIPELMEDGRTGVLVPFNDPAKLSAAIRELWGDPERCREYGRRAAEMAAGRYQSVTAYVTGILSYYRGEAVKRRKEHE